MKRLPATPRMVNAQVIGLALGLLALAAFCVFGALATYEPMDGGALGWRVGYGAAIVTCTYAALRLLRKGSRSR